MIKLLDDYFEYDKINFYFDKLDIDRNIQSLNRNIQLYLIKNKIDWAREYREIFFYRFP